MADTTTYDRMKGVAEALVSQLRSIDGSTGYHNRLDRGEVVLGAREASEQGDFPFICIPSISWMVKQETIGGANYIVSFEIEIHGHVKDSSNPLGAALDLGSDIERAIRADPTLGVNVRAFAIEMSPCEVASQDEFGGVLFTLTGKYPITET